MSLMNPQSAVGDLLFGDHPDAVLPRSTLLSRFWHKKEFYDDREYFVVPYRAGHYIYRTAGAVLPDPRSLQLFCKISAAGSPWDTPGWYCLLWDGQEEYYNA